MQFSSALVAAAAFAVANAVSFTNTGFNGVTAGEPFTFTWKDNQGPVTIRLKNGPSTNLKDVTVITSAQTGGTYTWNVPANLAKDTYAFDIVDASGVPNYSSQFELIGGADAPASASASPSASVTAVSSASASASVSSEEASSTTSADSTETTSVPSSASSTVSAPTSSATGASNSTVTSGRPNSTLASSASRTGSAGAATGTSTDAPSSGASDIASPLALVFLTVAALISLN